MSKATRTALAMAVIVVAVVVFIIVKPSNESSGTGTTSTAAAPAKPAIATVTVKNAKPVGGIQDLTFNKGGTVQFKVVSDTADEVHVHGYDFHKDVAPGHPITFRFPAKIDGEFDVELEAKGEQIASLRVNP